MSYARQDAVFALRVAADLKAKGANVWLDQLDIRPGRQWDREVEVALTACSEMLVVLSPAAVESNNVMDEVAFALEKRKVVIPILHRDCPVPFRLRRVQYVDFRTEYESAVQALLSALALEHQVDFTTDVTPTDIDANVRSESLPRAEPPITSPDNVSPPHTGISQDRSERENAEAPQADDSIQSEAAIMPSTVIDRTESVVAYGDASMPTLFLRERSGRTAAVLLIAALIGTLTTWVISWIMHDWSLLSADPQSWAMHWLPTLVPNIGMSIMTSLLVGAALWQHTSARTHLLWTATAGIVVAIIYGVATKSLYVSQVATVSFVPPPLFIVLDVGLSVAVALAITIAYEVLESRHMPRGESRD